MFNFLRKSRAQSKAGSHTPDSPPMLHQGAGNAAMASLASSDAGSSHAAAADRGIAGALAREAAAKSTSVVAPTRQQQAAPPSGSEGGTAPTRTRRGAIAKPGAKRSTSDTTTVKDGKTTRTTKTEDVLGYKGTSERSSDVFDGTTHRTSSAEHEGLLGVEVASKVIASSSDEEIKAAVESMARAGAFGESSRKAAIQRGRARASAQGSASGMVGGQAKGKFDLTVKPDLYQALALAIELEAKAGAEVNLSGEVRAGYGPVEVILGSKFDAFAGAMSTFKASLDVGITHFHAALEASGFLGVRGSASTELTGKLGPLEAITSLQAAASAGAQYAVEGELNLNLTHVTASGGAKVSAGVEGSVTAKQAVKAAGFELENSATAEAKAGAEAEASGKFQADITGVEAEGKFKAFAGVQAALKGAAKFGYRGVPVFQATGRIGVSAGAGISGEGAFVFRRGKVRFSGDVVAAIGVGEAAGLDVEMDFWEMSRAVYLVARDAHKKRMASLLSTPDGPVRQIPLPDPVAQVRTRKQGYEAYIKDFMAYDRKKARQGLSGIKQERVQEIINKRRAANKELLQFREFDQGIEQAAKDAFGSKLLNIEVKAGKVRTFDVKRTAEQAAVVAASQRA